MKQTNSVSIGAIGKAALRYKKILVVIGLILLVFIAGEFLVVNVTGAAPGSFLSGTQILLTIRMGGFIAIFALCQALVMCVGGFDLSVGFIATLTALLGASVMNADVNSTANTNIGLAVLIAIGVGLVFGLINGFLVSYLRLPALVVTMAVQYIAQGFVEAYVGGSYIDGRPAPILRTIAAESTAGIPNMVFLVIALCIVVSLVIYKTKFGVKLLGVGTNETVAYLCGVNVKLWRCLAYVVSGVVAGLAGLLLAGNAGFVFKDMASSYVMPSIVAVVVGGVSVNGGECNYFGVVLGAILIQVLQNLFIALNWGEGSRYLGYGAILMMMLILYVRNKRSR